MVYGIFTTLLLPYFFYDKLSLYFMNNKKGVKEKNNIKNDFDSSFDIIGMNQVLKKIFSFERFAWINY